MLFADSNLLELVLADLNHFDALFAFLGISTAFGLMRNKAGTGRESPTPEQAS